MMIHSLFMINNSGEIFMEKHWDTAISRSILDHYYDHQKKTANKCTKPVISTPNNHFLITIYRKKLTFVSVVTDETQHLIVVEFLHRIFDTFEDYFNNSFNESVIKENEVVVKALLDVMLQNGYHSATESNILKELIKPSNIFHTLTNVVDGESDGPSQRQVSTIPSPDIQENNEKFDWKILGPNTGSDFLFLFILGSVSACILRFLWPDIPNINEISAIAGMIIFGKCFGFLSARERARREAIERKKTV